jgi:hydrogenase expression/formation protein HypD
MAEEATAALQALLRSGEAARAVLADIRRLSERVGPVRLMEVCGTHTMAIRRAGIPSLLPPGVELLSGPGCPVCVTPNQVIDRAVALARLPGVCLATFGDMLRVPGSSTSLAEARAAGAEVEVVYSPLDALRLAEARPARTVVFAGVGFETTAPTVAAALQAARARRLPNFAVLAAHKLVPPALEALLARPDVRVDGFLMPGHVSVVIGSDAYLPVAARHGVPCVVAGFEPVDVLLAVRMLLAQRAEGRAAVEVEYRAVVRPGGNPHARALLAEVFTPEDSPWRGLGVIPGSGLGLAADYRGLDALARFPLELEPTREHPGCRCGEVLVGALRPPECALFGQACTPARPVGPCMVSSEGTCAAYHKFGG